ncbi:hypothetical protein ACFWY9_28560 [Amycolatopsis sp. NPDC059027]|uniref:hypothetical protein n=1 Tax=Amycolatopsis sp. NPDC059027 TaxID=3346709 RepID=UPI0036705C99
MPEERGFEYWFTRLEGKLDKLDEKLDGAVNTLGRHEERINALEKRQGDSWKTKSAVGVALISAVFSWIQPLITK